nr:unnamed protein product [Callosobruchus chinensis]
MDSELRFSKHLDQCINRCYSVLKVLHPYRHIFRTKLKTLLCDTFVLSLFNYCDQVYGSCLKSNDIDRIQKVQKSCLRYVFGVRKYEPISHKLSEAGWLNMLASIFYYSCFFCNMDITVGSINVRSRKQKRHSPSTRKKYETTHRRFEYYRF